MIERFGYNSLNANDVSHSIASNFELFTEVKHTSTFECLVFSSMRPITKHLLINFSFRRILST